MFFPLQSNFAIHFCLVREMEIGQLGGWGFCRVSWYESIHVQYESIVILAGTGIFNIPDNCGDFFEVLPKMVECALALCHSNTDVERSLSTNKKIVTKSNTSLKPETLRGLRAIKCAINEYGGVTKVPITLDMVSAAERSHSIYK